MAMTESVHNNAHRAPFGAITIYRTVDAITTLLTTPRSADIRAMSPAVREDLGVRLADIEASTPSVLTRAVTWVRDWQAQRRTVAALSALSDRQLDDIGLSRGDITRL